MMRRLLHPLLALLASATRQELARQVAYLKEENRILRARLPQRLVATADERRRLLRVGRRIGPQLMELISIVSYQTFRRWVRDAEAAHEKKNVGPRKPGRRRTPDDIRALVIRLRTETGDGYTKPMGRLRMLGIRISRQTAKKILTEAGLQPDPIGGGEDSWDAFLKRHADTLWQCDFVSKPMWTARGLVDLYFLVFLHIGTRPCWISPCTEAPGSAWVAQQAKNFLMDADDLKLAPAIVMRDNDRKYSAEFDDAFQKSGVEVKRNTPLSPNLRAHVERFIQTLKVECLGKFVIVGKRHLNHICREFEVWYNTERPHEARGHLPPVRLCEPSPSQTVRELVCATRLGGLLKHYYRAAA